MPQLESQSFPIFPTHAPPLGDKTSCQGGAIIRFPRAGWAMQEKTFSFTDHRKHLFPESWRNVPETSIPIQFRDRIIETLPELGLAAPAPLSEFFRVRTFGVITPPALSRPDRPPANFHRQRLDRRTAPAKMIRRRFGGRLRLGRVLWRIFCFVLFFVHF